MLSPQRSAAHVLLFIASFFLGWALFREEPVTGIIPSLPLHAKRLYWFGFPRYTAIDCDLDGRPDVYLPDGEQILAGWVGLEKPYEGEFLFPVGPLARVRTYLYPNTWYGMAAEIQLRNGLKSVVVSQQELCRVLATLPLPPPGVRPPAELFPCNAKAEVSPGWF